MAKPDLDKFEIAAEFGPVTKWERTVQTPMPANNDGSGYTTEGNRMVCYEVGEHLFKVSKVSHRGWTVTHYNESGPEWLQTGYEDTASKAHKTARTKVEELVE